MQPGRFSLQAIIFVTAEIVLVVFASFVIGASPPHYFGGVPDVSESAISGVRLSEVRPDSPAKKSGLEPGDVIVKLGKFTIKNVDDLLLALRSTSPGEPIEVVYVRHGQEYRTEATLVPRRQAR